MILMAHSYEDFLIILVFRNENPPDFSAVFLTGNKFQIKTRDNLICKFSDNKTRNFQINTQYLRIATVLTKKL